MPDEAVCISLTADAFDKGMDQSVLLSAMDK